MTLIPFEFLSTIIDGFMAFVTANMTSILGVAAFILGISIVMGILDSAMETSTLNTRKRL